MLIFMIASRLRRLSVIVDRKEVFISLSWLKLLSLSQVVMGSVRASFSKTEMLGNSISSHWDRERGSDLALLTRFDVFALDSTS